MFEFSDVTERKANASNTFALIMQSCRSAGAVDVVTHGYELAFAASGLLSHCGVVVIAENASDL